MPNLNNLKEIAILLIIMIAIIIVIIIKPQKAYQ